MLLRRSLAYTTRPAETVDGSNHNAPATPRAYRGRPYTAVEIAASGVHPARKRFLIDPSLTVARRSRAHAATGLVIPHAASSCDEL